MMTKFMRGDRNQLSCYEIFFYGFFLIARIAPGCASPTPSLYPSPAGTRAGRMRQDLQYRAKNLTRLHINAFHAVKKSEFFDAVAAQDQEVDGLTDRQFAVRMMQLVVLIGDRHARLHTPVPFYRSLPLRFNRFSDGVFASVLHLAATLSSLIGNSPSLVLSFRAKH